jgi:hypothetical protein
MHHLLNLKQFERSFCHYALEDDFFHSHYALKNDFFFVQFQWGCDYYEYALKDDFRDDFSSAINQNYAVGRRNDEELQLTIAFFNTNWVEI